MNATINITEGMQKAINSVKEYNESYNPCGADDVAAEMGCTVNQAKGYIGACIKAGLMVS